MSKNTSILAYAIDEAEENRRIAMEYKNLLGISYQDLNKADKKRIRLAFDTTVEAHKNQRRRSGEPYVYHPIAVAKIIASEIGMDATSVVAALLHDVVEDTHYTKADIEKLFGKTVGKIVAGLTKISEIDPNDNTSLQTENLKKILLTLNNDIRIIIIKIADRLHNLQTMESMPTHKQEKIASETLFIYAPIAHRIGLYNIKSELEDLSLKYTKPHVYAHIQNKIDETKEQQRAYIESFIETIRDILTPENIDFQIKGRPKNIYSIYQKILVNNISFEEVYDKFAIRIIYKSDKSQEKRIAWNIYTLITDYFQPNPIRLRDWITSPKFNGYEALHITVMGPKGQWVEIQIRSDRMDEIAEMGYAAHFKYKFSQQNREFKRWLDQIQEIFENNKDNSLNFLQDLRLDLCEQEIFVFTPKGELKSLPPNASPLDFAFLIHTQVGLHTKIAKVNDKLVPLNHKLKTGDQIEIITDDNAYPTFAWLEYTKTARAKSSIRVALKEKESSIITQGEKLLRRKFSILRIKLNDKTIRYALKYFNLKSKQDLFFKVSQKTISNRMLRAFANRQSFIGAIRSRIGKGNNFNERHFKYDSLVFGPDQKQLPYRLGACCNPIPGDEVFGFENADKNIRVHKKNCPNSLLIYSNYSYRVTSAKWIDTSKENFYSVIEITGVDKVGVVNNITDILSKQLSVDIRSLRLSAESNHFRGRISLKVPNNESLKHIIKHLKKVDGVEKVIRK